MGNQHQKPQKYKTPRSQPKCVKYWDRKFRTLNIWFNWVATKSHVDHTLTEVMTELEMRKPEAREIAWGAFVAAVLHEESPIEHLYNDLLSAVEPIEFPLLFCYLMIGADIFNGQSERDAIFLHKEWLTEGDNAIFGDFKITTDFIVVPRKRR